MPSTKHRGRTSSSGGRPSTNNSIISNSSCCNRGLFGYPTLSATLLSRPTVVVLHSAACSSNDSRIQAWSTQSAYSAAPSPDLNELMRPTSRNSKRWYAQSRNFACYFFRLEFLLRIDNAALRNLLRRDLSLTCRVECLFLRLYEYNFKIEYKRGQDNVIVDVLSRLQFAMAKNLHTERR